MRYMDLTIDSTLFTFIQKVRGSERKGKIQ